MTEEGKFGFPEPEKQSGGNYLNLSGKGDSCRIRIVGPPLVWQETMKSQRTGREHTQTRYAFKVVHKEVINGEPHMSVKGFRCGPQVYARLYDLLCSEEWGDLRLYDVKITRTEEPGRYYTVQPVGAVKENTEQVENLIELSEINLTEMYLETGKDKTVSESSAVDPFEDRKSTRLNSSHQ